MMFSVRFRVNVSLAISPLYLNLLTLKVIFTKLAILLSPFSFISCSSVERESQTYILSFRVFFFIPPKIWICACSIILGQITWIRNKNEGCWFDCALSNQFVLTKFVLHRAQPAILGEGVRCRRSRGGEGRKEKSVSPFTALVVGTRNKFFQLSILFWWSFEGEWRSKEREEGEAEERKGKNG